MSFIMRPIRFASTGHIIEGSGLFNGSSGYLSRTPGSDGDERQGTIEFIVKPSEFADTMLAYQARAGGAGTAFWVYITSSYQIRVMCENDGGTAIINHITTPVFRDPSAYYHIVVNFDGDTTGNGCVNIYVNGTQITDFGTRVNLSTATDLNLMNSTKPVAIGFQIGNASYLDGYLARATYIDGQALNPTSFGEVTDDGFWSISDVSELTFGTNGFLIEGGTNMAAGTNSNSSAVSTYDPDAAQFDGTNDYGTRTSALTGTSGSETKVCGSVWVRFNDTAQDDLIVSMQNASGDSDHNFNLRRKSSNGAVALRIWKLGAGVYVQVNSEKNLDDGLWHHIAWNIDISSGPTIQLYVDGVDDKAAGGTESTGTIVANCANIGIGIDQRTSGEILKGDIADLWVQFGENLDLSTSSNLEKFRSSNGEPVDLGSTGQTPTGTTPEMFFHLDDGETANNFMTNAGSGGTITLAGTLSSTSLSPLIIGNSFYPTGTITATNDSPTNGDAS